MAMSEALTTLGEKIVAGLGGAATGHSMAFGQLTVTVQADRIVEVVKLLRDLHRPPGHAAAVDRLWLRRASAAQGFPAHRLCRGALRRPGEEGGLRTRPPQSGIPQIRFPLAMGRRGLSGAARREEKR